MEKEENYKTKDKYSENTESKKKEVKENLENSDLEKENTTQVAEKTLEEKIIELEDKVARTFAEMENQRRRFEKEKEEAFEYGGFTFAKESLNLIDNLERSKSQ